MKSGDIKEGTKAARVQEPPLRNAKTKKEQKIRGREQEQEMIGALRVIRQVKKGR